MLAKLQWPWDRAIKRLIKGRDAAREIAVFTNREKTRLTRAIWCIAEVEGARTGTGSWHEPRSMDHGSQTAGASGRTGGWHGLMQQAERHHAEVCTTVLAPLTTARGQRHTLNRRQAEGRQ